VSSPVSTSKTLKDFHENLYENYEVPANFNTLTLSNNEMAGAATCEVEATTTPFVMC
jgi:hypothetical protein